MKLQNLSVRAFLRLVIMGGISTSAFLILTFYFFTGSGVLALCGLFLTITFSVWGIFFLKFFQKRLSEFTNSLCRTLDDMINGSERPFTDLEAETSLARISHRLERLYNIMQVNSHKAEEERAELQSLLSDISHQTKTPISNLKMINDTLLTRRVTEEKQKE